MKRLEEIYAYRKITPWLHTSGQPSRAQLAHLCEHGIRHVVNLALPSSEDAVQSEAAVLAESGITYLGIPVDFNRPKRNEFKLFSSHVDCVQGAQTLVHCAKNMRVSAFVYLYRVLSLGHSEAAADREMRLVWEPDVVWSSFIEAMLEHRPGN